MTTARFLLGAAILVIGGLIIFNLIKTSSPDFSQTIPKVSSESLDGLNLENWHEFSPATGDFQVLLPILPQHVTKTFTNPSTKDVRKYDMFVSERDNGTIFMISQITFLEVNDAKLDETMLHSVVDDMLSSNKNNKLKSLKNTQFAQQPALEFTIENDQAVIDGKTFIIDKTLYLLTLVAKQGLYKPKESAIFINSFGLAKSDHFKLAPTQIDPSKTSNAAKE